MSSGFTLGLMGDRLPRRLWAVYCSYSLSPLAVTAGFQSLAYVLEHRQPPFLTQGRP